MKPLLADIGGTHVRFALAEESGLVHPQKLKASEYDGFDHAVDVYLKSVGEQTDEIYAATAAWPNENGVYLFSNLSGWDFDPEAMRSKGYKIGRVYNDFEAGAYGALSLPKEEKKCLREGREPEDYPVLICGPGTGLGLAYALPIQNGRWRVQPTFGGHILPGSYTQDQYEVAKEAARLSSYKDALSFEHLASGRGLPLLHQAVCAVHDLQPFGDNAIEILDHAHEKSVCLTLEYFHVFLGLFIHNAVVTTHSYGGVYLNGGMIDRLMEKNLFDFANIEKSMMVPLIEYVDHIMQKTPVYYVSDPFLALKGLMEIRTYGESLLNN